MKFEEARDRTGQRKPEQETERESAISMLVVYPVFFTDCSLSMFEPSPNSCPPHGRYLSSQSQLDSAKMAFHEVDKHIFEWPLWQHGAHGTFAWEGPIWVISVISFMVHIKMEVPQNHRFQFG